MGRCGLMFTGGLAEAIVAGEAYQGHRVVIYLGLILCTAPVERKLRSKHRLSSEDVREALQHPAKARTAWEEDGRHGQRLIAMGRLGSGRLLIAWLIPIPDWDPDAEVWLIKTARWVR